MAIATVQGINAYFEELVGAYTQHSRLAVLNKPNDVRYSENGMTLMVRDLVAATTGAYDKNAGWMGTANAGAVNWIGYTPQAERSVVVSVDAREERQSRAAGMPSSFAALAGQSVREKVAPEADAVGFAALFNKIPAANVLTTGATGADISVAGIMATLDSINRQLINRRVGGRVYLFLSTLAYGNLTTAIRNVPGAAAFVQRKVDRQLVTGLEQILLTYQADQIRSQFVGAEADRRINELIENASMLDVSIDVISWGRFDIIPVPDDSFYSAVTLYDGVSTGQTQGGYAPSTGARTLQLMAVPDGSAFAAIAYDNNTIFVPNAPDFIVPQAELETIQSAILNTPFRIGGIGLNPLGDRFTSNLRVQMGADVLNARANTLFCIADAAA
jgi:hypothetical protein